MQRQVGDAAGLDGVGETEVGMSPSARQIDQVGEGNGLSAKGDGWMAGPLSRLSHASFPLSLSLPAGGPCFSPARSRSLIIYLFLAAAHACDEFAAQCIDDH
jgi:hypothetical protein